METYLSIQKNQKITGYTVQEKTHQEKKHLVVPVTMIVEGVLQGSAGPLLHLAEDFGKFPEAWNGIPVVINHPEKDGQSVSANSPELIDAGTVGRVYNSRIENNCLKAEVWLEETKLGAVSPDTLSAIGLKQSIEVSVGVFTEYDKTPGTYNGREYTAIARNHRPDHLALLPGGVGACSIADGCGIRVNSKKKGEPNEMSEVTHEQRQQFQQMKYAIRGIVDNSTGGLKEKLDELRNLVGSLDVQSTQDKSGIYHYLEEAYDTYLVYEKYGDGEEKYYKQGYQIAVDGSGATFVGDPVEVEKKVTFENVIQANNLFTRTKIPKTKSMSDEKKCTPCIEKKATELIANKATKFTEADRGWLETFEEVQLDRMIPTEAEIVANKLSDEEITKLAANQLSAEDKASLDFGKRVIAARKAEMTKGIQANTVAGTWSEADLVAMSESMLEKVYKSVVKEDLPVDYSLNGNVKVQVNSSEIAPLIPNTVN